MKCYLLLLYSTQIPYCYSMVSYLTMLILGTWMRPNSVFLLVIVGLLLHSLTWFPLIAGKNVLETVWEKKSNLKMHLVWYVEKCVWMDYSMCACHFLLLPELWIIFEMWSNLKKWKWGMGFCLLVWTFQCYIIFCDWCKITKHFTSKSKMYNCLIISKSHVAFQDVLAVTNACPSIFSKLFTVNKVAFIVKFMSPTCYCFLVTGNTRQGMRDYLFNSYKNSASYRFFSETQVTAS